MSLVLLFLCLPQLLMPCDGKNTPDRKRKFGAGHPSALRTAEEQLFFALFYLKSYPTVDVLSFLVGFDRSNACRNAQFLFSALTRALGRKLVLPKRQITSVEEFFREFPEAKDIFIDGTERRVQKPVSQKRRKRLYSGKRKQPPGKLWLSPMTGNESSSLRRPNPADVTTNASLTKPWEAEISH